MPSSPSPAPRASVPSAEPSTRGPKFIYSAKESRGGSAPGMAICNLDPGQEGSCIARVSARGLAGAVCAAE